MGTYPRRSGSLRLLIAGVAALVAFYVLVAPAAGAHPRGAAECLTSFSTTTSTTEPPADLKALRISLWDESVENPADAMEIQAGDLCWWPDLRYHADAINGLGFFPVDETQEVIVYPDGPDGAEIKVECTMTADMISGSDLDQVWIDVYDDRIEVFGGCIPDFEVHYDR